MKNWILVIAVLLLYSCKKEETNLQENILSDYIELNNTLELDDLIACAGGKTGGLFNVPNEPTTVFFYPITGATDFKYFEAENISDSLDFSKYYLKVLPDAPVFNGYLWKFNNTNFAGERMGVVTYKTPGKLHVCTPIRQKTNIKPTEINSSLVTVIDNGVNPTFLWEDGLVDENIIYFQVISDSDGNLISGTYTYEKTFSFYDISNVVLNITDPSISPTLEADKDYTFTMMGVSEDNWVNLLIEKEFTTN